MTPDEICEVVYEKGFIGGIEKLPFELKQLWHYIDFTIYVDNGGPTGFINNKSPTEDERSNYFLPYLESWKFFGLLELAHLVEEYNAKFLEAVRVYNLNGKQEFKKYEKEFGVGEIIQVLNPLIVKIVWTNKNRIVWNWIDKNRDRLQIIVQAI
jgi:hypothetical protein